MLSLKQAVFAISKKTSPGWRAGGRWAWCLGLFVAGLSGCGGASDSTSQSACSDVNGGQVCTRYSDSGSALLDVIEFWVQLDTWSSSYGGQITEAWSPLAKVEAQPRSAKLSFVSGQAQAVQQNFALSVWPAQAAAQMHFKLEAPAGWLAGSTVVNLGSLQPELQLWLRTDRPPGPYSTRLRLYLCRGTDCAQSYLGSPLELALTLDVR
jgi:hypothetical protein